MIGRYPFLGYSYQGGRYGAPARLDTVEEILSFIKNHLDAEQVVLTDSSDELWFQALAGVDHFSRLAELGIDLPELYRLRRQEILNEAVEPASSRQSWEDVYDQVGLDSAEIRMRQQIKRLAKAAKTVADVARLVEGTYFDVLFCLSDGEPAWGGFDPQGFSVSVLHDDPSLGQSQRIILGPLAGVRHVASGEDIHLFELVEPPG